MQADIDTETVLARRNSRVKSQQHPSAESFLHNFRKKEKKLKRKEEKGKIPQRQGKMIEKVVKAKDSIKIKEETVIHLAQSTSKLLVDERLQDCLSLTGSKNETDWKSKYDTLKDSQFKQKFWETLEGNDATFFSTNKKSDLNNVLESSSDLNEDLYQEFCLRHKEEAFQKLLESRKNLPTWNQKEHILKAVEENQVVIVCGETGCGKTTQIAQFLLDEAIELKRGSTFRAVCTQPRRLAAISVAHRVADERCEPCGNNSTSSVGYQIRLERRSPRERGSVLFCTTGILVQLLLSDPYLENYSHILLDEVHERDLMIDFVMTIVRDLLPKRPKLRVILMSATIESSIFSTYFHNCPVLTIPGKIFPVQVFYLEDVLTQLDYRVRSQKSSRSKNSESQDAQSKQLDIEYAQLMEPIIEKMEANRSYPLHVFKSLRRRESEEAPEMLILSLLKHVCTRELDGAILVFFPGWEQIKRLNKLLLNDRSFSGRKYLIYTLHSMMPTTNQRQIFEKPPKGVRKIILSTNIAETSLTIDDVVYVIDCGKAKQSYFDPKRKLHTLNAEWITLANGHQRQGRAGRTKPGICYRLYSRGRESLFEPHPTPEIKRIRLEELILRIKILKLGQVETFLRHVPEPPDDRTVKVSLELLYDLGALDYAERLTPLGFHLGQLPTDPRTGKLILLGAIFGCLEPMLSIAAALSFRDPFVMPMNQEENYRKTRKMLDNGLFSDHLLIVKVIRQFRAAEREGGYTCAKNYCHNHFLSTSTMTMISNMVDQLCRELYQCNFLGSACASNPADNINSDNNDLILSVLCAGLLPNIAEVNIAHSKLPKRSPAKKTTTYQVKTAEDGNVFIHPRSVNYDAQFTQSTWLCYHSKVKSSSIFLHDCSVVPPLAVLFFGGEHLQRKLDNKCRTRLRFKCDSSTLETTQTLNTCWENYLCKRVSDPGPTDWSSGSSDSSLLRAIIEFTTASVSFDGKARRSTKSWKENKTSRQCYDLVSPENLVHRQGYRHRQHNLGTFNLHGQSLSSSSNRESDETIIQKKSTAIGNEKLSESENESADSEFSDDESV